VEEDGSLQEVATTGGAPCGLAVDHTNALHVCDLAHAAVLLLKDEVAVASGSAAAAGGGGKPGSGGGAHAHAHHNHHGSAGAPVVVVNEYEGKSLRGPNSACFDSAGQLFFTDSGPLGETGLLERKGSVFVVTGEANTRLLRPLAYESLAHPAGICLNAEENAVFVSEMAANRVLRFVQRPAGVWHASVFHQFAGRLGPTALAFDGAHGHLYVARYELPELAERGLVSVLSAADGSLVREIVVAGPEVTGLALSPDGDVLVVSEATGNTITKVVL
jgi:sugar lactone lactonase YvrE